MTEKRHVTRKNRRLEVRFGPEEPTRIGFIGDITLHGFFIQTAGVCRPGTLLTVVLNMKHDQEVRLQGRVQWAKRVPPQMLHRVKKGGMGIRIECFLSGEAVYRSYCANLNV